MSKNYSNEHPKYKKITEDKTTKIAKYEVGNLKRPTLVKHLKSMELPETDPKDFDDEHIKEMLINFAPDLFKDSRD